MDLIESLRGVSKEIRQKRRYATDEAKTRSFLVEPFLKRLGYDPGNPDDVTPEFTAGFVAKKTKVDYALKKDGKPIIFVEVKSATKDLAHEHTEQLQIYFSTKLAVRFGILTNGLEYRFYTDLDNANVMDDAPFLIVDMSNFDQVNAANLSVYQKSSFQVDSAKSHALGLKYKLTLRSVLETEFRTPSDELIKLFIKRIRPELKNVTKNVSEEMSPIVKEVWAEFSFGGQDARIDSPTDAAPQETPISSIPDSTTFLEKYSLDGSVEVPVFANFEEHEFEASLSLYGRLHSAAAIIRYEEKWLTPLEAGKRTRITIDPNANYYVNGMTYWQLRDPATGELRPINDLRYDEKLLLRVLRKR